MATALRISTKVDDSSTGANTTLGALDFAATIHFLPDPQLISNGIILVGCANENVMRAVATDKLNLQALPEAAKLPHKFKKNEITLPL